MIGVVQRNEADMTLWHVSADDLPFDPGFVGVPTMAKEGRILSIPRPAKYLHLDILDVLRNFDQITWSYYVITCTMVLATLVSIWLMVGRGIFSRLEPSRLLKSIYGHAWFVNVSFLDQIEYNPRDIKRRILWYLFCWFLFFTFEINGSLMSSEMTVQSPVPHVDTLEDIVSPEFDYIVPRFIPQSGMVNIFDQEPIGSKSVYRRIYDKALAYEKYGQHSFVRFNAGKFSDMEDAYKYLYLSGNSAILQSANYLSQLVKVACYLNDSSEFHISHDRYRSYTYSFIYSKVANVETRNFLDRRTRRLMEIAIFKVSTDKQITEASAKALDMDVSQSLFNCINMVKPIRDQVIDQVSLDIVRPALSYFAYACTFALVVLILENISHRFKQICRIVKTGMRYLADQLSAYGQKVYKLYTVCKSRWCRVTKTKVRPVRSL